MIDITAKGIHTHRIMVAEEAIDANGHASNICFVQWMQEAAVGHSDAVGCTAYIEKAGTTWVVRTHEIEYLHPARVGDSVRILTWISNCRKVRSLRKYRFLREPDGLLLASGQTDWVYVDATSGRPRAIPAELVGLFTVVPEGDEP